LEGVFCRDQFIFSFFNLLSLFSYSAHPILFLIPVEKLSKESFMDLVKSSGVKAAADSGASSSRQSSVPSKVSTQAGSEAEKPKAWSILSDNFMMDAKLKDWDKESDSEDDD